MVKTKTKIFKCAAHWDIRPELWVGRGWTHPHQIGRCRFWNPRRGHHEGKSGKCDKYPDITCPHNGWRDFTKMIEEVERKRNRQYSTPLYLYE